MSFRRSRRAGVVLLAITLALSWLGVIPVAPGAGTLGPRAGTLGPAVAAAAPADAASKLRGDLARMVAGEIAQDARIGRLVAGHRPGELAYLALLSLPNDAARQAELSALGARVLRAYRSLDVVALASSPADTLRVAALPWVTRLAPVELVFAAYHGVPGTDETRGTPADVGAPDWWARGVTGRGVRIAVLDTGLDPLHPDLDELDWRRWSALPGTPKVVDARDFVAGGCRPLGTQDGHGHGTHVAGIATGTAEGGPTTGDDGRYPGIAPEAELAVAKVLTDAGAGINSDLIAALEWATLPEDREHCSIGADIVNLSLGSEARPGRLNSGSDIDFVSLFVDRLTVRTGAAIVAAAGNSGPYIGSALEAPGSAAQAISVAAAAKDWDVNHDDTASGETCAGWRHRPAPGLQDNDCSAGFDAAHPPQPPSIASFSSRGPSGGLWLRPDIAAPGYMIVSAQSSTGVAIAQNDVNRHTKPDPLYATASGTSMAAPAASGALALALQAYRDAHGADPTGASGLDGLRARASTLLRAAAMNTAASDLFESRWLLTTDAATRIECPETLDPLLLTFCRVGKLFLDTVAEQAGTFTAYEARNRLADPYVGPLAEGAGKLHVTRTVAALRDGLVIYSAAASGAAPGTGPREFQGSWQMGPVGAGESLTQRFVLHAAPGSGPLTVRFGFEPGQPSDGSRAIPTGGSGGWSVTLPGETSVPSGGDVVVSFSAQVPADAAPGTYTGRVVAAVDGAPEGARVLALPVFAAVALQDADQSAGASGPQARYASAADVFAKDDTTWPSLAGAALGAAADWLVHPVDLADGLSSATLRAWDSDGGDDETYDIYVYDANLDLIAGTHPFGADGTTDVARNSTREGTTEAVPAEVVLRTPAAGRYFVAINRARINRGPFDPLGDFGSYELTLDEVRSVPTTPAASTLAYAGDHVVQRGASARLAARLTDASGLPIAGRRVEFTLDGGGAPCAGGTCSASTDARGLAQLSTEPITLAAGVHEVHVRFAGDAFWAPSGDDAFLLVVGTGLPPVGSGGRVSGGGWSAAEASSGAGGSPASDAAARIHFALHADSPTGAAPSGDMRWRDRAAGVELTLVAWAGMSVSDGTATLVGSARTASGQLVEVRLTLLDRGEPGHADAISLAIAGSGYERGGTLGGGNLQVDTAD
ncbi:MAG TPA: S8 family serine peptidase [Candidatus Limnocylindrales bacterium]|nr:S8 family serine peptidase [Candidatus Limnocylindrales bacterium]